MGIKKRLRQYADYKIISHRKFSLIIGKSEKFLASDGEIQSDVFIKIRKHFPDLSLIWLLFDEGEMIVSEKKHNQFVEKSAELKKMNYTFDKEKVDYNTDKMIDNILDKKIDAKVEEYVGQFVSSEAIKELILNEIENELDRIKNDKKNSITR